MAPRSPRRSPGRSWKGCCVVEPETIVDGRYRVVSRLGSGGMADVYLAEDQLLGRQVAVKVLHHHFAEDQEFVERFRREASSAAGLSHPNIVGIFDRGEWNGTYYIAMEYVAGRSLKSIVRERGALDPATAIDIVVQILRATWFAHKRGVIHRDLKPHNVLLDEEGRVRVTDFGIARAGASDMTLTGSIMGTAQYLSPEQAQGQAVSAASDLYSIGVILYELLTGVVPFEGETAVAIAFKQVSAEPRPPSALNPSLPAALDAVVLRALAKDPAQRYADAEEFIAVLQRERGALTAASGVALAAEGSPAGRNGATGPLLLPPAGRFDEEAGSRAASGRRRRALLWTLAAVLAAALVALALLLGTSRARVTVPDVTGQTEQVALVVLRRAGLNPVALPRPSATVASGLVIGETPPRGSIVNKGTRVSVLVSSGPATAPLLDVKGLSPAQAARRLRAAGFNPTIQTQPSATIPQGQVISTNPSPGTVVTVGSTVTVLVSSGPAQVHVPNVTGQPQTDAEASLTSVGLTVGTITQQVSTTQSPGAVLQQSPSAGSSLGAGGKVNLVVAQAPKEVPVPGVVGQDQTQAAAALGRAGFTPKPVTATTTDPTQVGLVLKQSPAAGHQARPGATVTITIGTLSPPRTTPSTTPSTTPTTTTTTTTTTTPPLAAG
jgi:beta-lactam-binding protein with PASTA domain/predicted Ser/Thr protein kinase